MSISPTAVVKMPSENSFKKQADVARDALKNFNTVRALNAPSLAKTALSELVEATVSFIFPMSIFYFSCVNF
jgi:predicted translin family RNA/ssDNA-binding protein